ncbi:putative bifunctional diguanylate cyclase/phosphodiesterase [Paractinoplanes rishiriensis]|uniref:GGDEF-domain containing protein n=1 Tax=Paractinoplanes rishiriensis TaxID=1050105 RepID=A0A919JWW0_9ACTN|nr:EAL domain-containing protein [Actinoplanes rishiriensis]GIE94608.1 GGDEF-domain containing protein [Actinoplanes rishiriensis]
MQSSRRPLVQNGVWLLCLAALTSLQIVPAQAPRLHAVMMMLVTVGGTVFHVVRAVRLRGHARRVWSLTAAGLACWAYAEVAVGIDSLRTGVTVERDLPTNLLNMMALVFAVAAMLAIPTAPGSAAGRLRMLLDGLIAASALFGVVWVLVLKPMIKIVGETTAIWDITYPVAAIAVLAVGVVLMAGTRRRDAGAMVALTGGVLVVTVALLIELTSEITLRPDLMTWALDGYILAAGLIAVAPRFALPRREHREWRPASTAFGVLPYLPMALYLLVCLVPTFAGQDLDRPAVWAGTVLVCAVLARQFLTIRRNIALSRDLAEERARFAYEAAHDPLTGLPNRAQLNEELDRAPAGAVLLMIDLDGFKAVNDTLGHAAGDQLLVVIADRLNTVVAPHGALCARLGGDEFAVLLHYGGLEGARDLARTLLEQCAAPVPLDGRIATVRASIGIAVAGAGRPAALLREADLALYEAKHRGKGQFRVFDQHLSAAAEEQRRLEAELGAALAGGQFALAYQPVVDLATGRTTGVEQLLRWHHPRLGVLGAEAFLPAAADAGLLPEIDRWVVDAGVADLARWRAADPDFQISLHLSSRYLSCGTVADDLRQALAVHRQPATSVYVRIGDGSDLAELAPVLAEVRAIGVRVVLDRFGVGHSAVAHLRDLEVDGIKLHPAFLREVATSPESADLLGAVIARAASLGLACVAGGVTSAADAEHLRRIGCRAAHGSLFGEPVPAGRVPVQDQITYA